MFCLLLLFWRRNDSKRNLLRNLCLVSSRYVLSPQWGRKGIVWPDQISAAKQTTVSENWKPDHGSLNQGLTLSSDETLPTLTFLNIKITFRVPTYISSLLIYVIDLTAELKVSLSFAFDSVMFTKHAKTYLT